MNPISALRRIWSTNPSEVSRFNDLLNSQSKGNALVEMAAVAR
jgi:hypothetical protein